MAPVGRGWILFEAEFYLMEECVNQGRYNIAVISGEKICMSWLGKKKTIWGEKNCGSVTSL